MGRGIHEVDSTVSEREKFWPNATADSNRTANSVSRFIRHPFFGGGGRTVSLPSRTNPIGLSDFCI